MTKTTTGFMQYYILRTAFPYWSVKKKYDDLDSLMDGIRKIFRIIPKMIQKKIANDQISSKSLEDYDAQSLWEYVSDNIFVKKIDIEFCPLHQKMFVFPKKGEKCK